MGKLFGTDGVRGVANIDITPELAFKLGLAGAYILTKQTQHIPKIIVGVDTRISCDMLQSALVAGMCAVGADVYLAGVIPTPGIAHLVKEYNFDAGVMISASHNSFEDNGIKFFNQEGYKLSDEIELEIEQIIESKMQQIERATGSAIGNTHIHTQASEDYTNFLHSIFKNTDLTGLKVAIDCANGATYDVAPTILKKLNAQVFISHNKPNGTNINKYCGSTHMQSLQKFVVENKADIGIAFDGDGDRCLIVNSDGTIIDGYEIMSMLAIYLKQNNMLKNNTLVATVMSNLGLFIMGEKLDINIEQTSVGDRYVLERLLEGGFNLGGEQSGHIIFLNHNTTGDGILTALYILKIMKETNKKLSELNVNMQVLPQVLVNAKVNNYKKYEYLNDNTIQTEIKKLEDMFAGNGRVLIRPSGTEALVRVMIEGLDIEVLQKEAGKLALLIESKFA